MIRRSEWTLDIPLNRKSYVCNIDQAQAQGDSCLKLEEGIGISPSRLTLGAKLFPWEGRGLSLLAAFDVGTSGTGTFIDETVPELPWNLWLGVGYASIPNRRSLSSRGERAGNGATLASSERAHRWQCAGEGHTESGSECASAYDDSDHGHDSDESGSRSSNLLPGPTPST